MLRHAASVASTASVRCTLLVSAAGDVGAAKAVTDATWEETVLKSPVPVLVEVYASFCGPCRMVAPIVDKIAAQYGDKILAVRAVNETIVDTLWVLRSTVNSETAQIER